MNFTGKPLWLEGMFLRPQHLQQHDRWIETSVEQRVGGLVPYSWGLRGIELDMDALANGQVQVTSADLVFPDGTPYVAPTSQPLPPARHLTQAAQGKLLYLALPLKAAGSIEVAENDTANQRYRKTTTEVQDNALTDRPGAEIFVGTLNVRIVVEGEPLDELVFVPIGEVETIGAQGQITLSQTYIPPAIQSGASIRLLSIMEQVRGLLKNRAQTLASGAMGRGDMTRSGMLDLMTLGIANRYEAIFNHLIVTGRHAPEMIYRECIGLIGELSAYAGTDRRPPELPAYDHDDLRATFEPLLGHLRGLLSVIIETGAINIPLSERDFGIWLGEIEDRMTFQGRRFVLIAQANVALERIRSQMPIQIKIGPVEQIRDLVNLQLPGIGIEPLSVAPREIPFIQNAVYFQLDSNNPLWSQFRNSAAFALHVSGDYPGLNLELWAIQKGH